MSSTLDISTILSSISVMEKELAALRAQLGATTSVVPSTAKTVKKERKKSNAPPSAWRLFADRVRTLLGANGYSGKALGTECVQFASALKEENADFSSWVDADILARRAAWSAPEVSKAEAKYGKNWVKNEAWLKPKTGSSSSSVVSDGEATVVSVPAPAPAPTAVSDGEASVSSDKKKPGPSKGKKWSAETKAAAAAKRAAKKATTETATSNAVSTSVLAPLPPSPQDSDNEDETADFQRVSLGGAKYWVNLKSGHSYRRGSDDSRGDWAGLFVRDPKPRIDDSVADPNGELDFD